MPGSVANAMNPIEISLVAPCLNEQDNVEILCSRFLETANLRSVHVEIVFVDDGSTDLTWERLLQLKSENPGSITLVRHTTNRGIPQGWISGVDAAKGNLVCLIDSDLQNPPESVFTLYDRIVVGDVDVVRGVRRPIRAQPRSRVILSRSLNFVLNFIFGMNSSDNKSGFIIGNREVIRRCVHHTGHYVHYQTFIGVALHARGYSTAEVDTPFEDRRSGMSFLSGRSIRVVREVFKDIPEAQWEFGSRFATRRRP